MIKKIFLVTFLLGWSNVYPDGSVLEDYIHEGLENNLALKQEEFSLQQSLYALKGARGMFMPSIEIQARYSRAGGGRDFIFPVGDLINPVHKTLNALLQEQRFPENLPNQNIPFLRKEEHDTRLRVVQPLFQPKIYYNYKINQNLVDSREAQKRIFARQLVANIKSAFFDYSKAVSVTKLLLETEILLKENLRVSKKLFQAGSATEEVVFRAQVELSKLEQQQAEAEKNRILAAAFFNFLLNRSLDESIISVREADLSSEQDWDLSAAESKAVNNREEFVLLRKGIQAAQNHIKLNRSAYLPGISIVFDYGFEGEKYRFGSSDDFWMGSAVLNWNIFNGFQDKAKIQQAKLEKKKLNARLAELENQIRFKVREAYQQMVVAGKTVLAARDQVVSARKSFKIIEKKFAEGMSPQIDYLDARTTLTNSGINLIIAKYDYQISLGELERAAALFPFPEDKKEMKRGKQ